MHYSDGHLDDKDEREVCGPYFFIARKAADPFQVGAALLFQDYIFLLPGREGDEYQ